jgi:hypothetical protein
LLAFVRRIITFLSLDPFKKTTENLSEKFRNIDVFTGWRRRGWRNNWESILQPWPIGKGEKIILEKLL